MLKTNALKHLEKSDYSFFGLILLYAAYSFVRNALYNSYRYAEIADFSIFLFTLDLVVLLLILSIVLISIFRHNWDAIRWGIATKKDLWFAVAFVFLSMVYSWKYTPSFAVEDILWSVQIIVFVMSNELVIRAALISRLVGILGKERKGVFLAIAISSVLYAVAAVWLIPFKSSIAASVIAGYIFYYFGSIFFNIFILSSFYFPNELGFYVGAATFFIYFAVSYSGKRLERWKSTIVTVE